jgi:hypothetical protein
VKKMEVSAHRQAVDKAASSPMYSIGGI